MSASHGGKFKLEFLKRLDFIWGRVAFHIRSARDRRGDEETGRRGDEETGRRGDEETGRRGDEETGRRGDGETRRRGDGETRRRGDGETRRRRPPLISLIRQDVRQRDLFEDA